MRKVIIAKSSGLTPQQIEAGAIYLTISTGRHAQIKDLMAARSAKTFSEIADIFERGDYKYKYNDVYEQYKAEIKKGMKSRISLFDTKPWFLNL
jgi:hypothetical protein